jgi:hypothetical protein
VPVRILDRGYGPCLLLAHVHVGDASIYAALEELLPAGVDGEIAEQRLRYADRQPGLKQGLKVFNTPSLLV